MALTNAQMQAVINAGGSVHWPPDSTGTIITTIGGLPTDPQISAYFAGVYSASLSFAIPFAIAINQSLSAGVDLAGQGILRLISDVAWTAAALTMQVSQDGVTYVDRRNSDGTEWTGPTLATGTQQSFDLDITANSSFRFVKLRSGTSGTPVNQAAARSLTLITRGF